MKIEKKLTLSTTTYNIINKKIMITLKVKQQGDILAFRIIEDKLL